MLPPYGFSWVDRPHLAGLARPESTDEIAWLRHEGIQLLISLTEDPLPRSWVNDAGLFNLHVPIEDMYPPSPAQIQLCVSAIDKAKSQNFGVGVHCAAGMGRTGTILACYLVARHDMTGHGAVERIRNLRPGSIETDEQRDSVIQFARRLRDA